MLGFYFIGYLFSTHHFATLFFVMTVQESLFKVKHDKLWELQLQFHYEYVGY